MIHGSTSLEVIVSMLACSRLGITHCVIFQELSIDAIKKRINLSQRSFNCGSLPFFAIHKDTFCVGLFTNYFFFSTVLIPKK